MNAVRETFEEKDLVRSHPIITKGGDMVNNIPDRVVIESYVRAKSFDAIYKNNKKINRAAIGAALSIGANVEIKDYPGYGPLDNAPEMIDLASEAASLIIPHQKFHNTGRFNTGSTDMGDLTQIMPGIHPYAGGAVGDAHADNYYISDPVSACLDSAKWQLAMLKLLLEDNAARAKRIKASFKPRFASKDEYLAFLDNLFCEGDRITYTDTGAEVKI